jgi:N-acyl homoserine lactone hydrolase
MRRLFLPLVVIVHLSACTATLPQEKPFDVFPARPGPADWSAAFAAPQEIDFIALFTGEIKVARSVLIDLNNPATADRKDRDVWVPVMAYLVRHPRYGAILLDSGFDESFAKSGHGNFGGLAVFVDVTRQTNGHDVVSLLRQAGVDPSELKMILLSHAHPDHTAGLPALPTNVPVVGGPGAILGHEVKWYAPSEHFAGRAGIAALSFEGAPDSGPGRSLDLFGDGSLFILDTPGHAPGNLSVIVNGSGGPVLLTFDASHLQEGFRDGIAPGKVAERLGAQASLERLRAFAAANPGLRVVAGHEASDWSETNGLRRLDPSAAH